jgi:hypothetical protein
MRQDGRPRRRWAIVRSAEKAAEHGAEAHHLEVRSAHDPRLDDARFAEADQRELDGREVAEGADGAGA